MKPFRILIVTSIFILLSGCTSMNTPSPSLIETMPVVTVGEAHRIHKEHIVFIPANTKFPVEFSVKGSVFTENASSKVMVSFKQDMYLYKYWASLDEKKWVSSHKLMNVKPSGGFDKSGGKIEVEIEFSN